MKIIQNILVLVEMFVLVTCSSESGGDDQQSVSEESQIENWKSSTTPTPISTSFPSSENKEDTIEVVPALRNFLNKLNAHVKLAGRSRYGRSIHSPYTYLGLGGGEGKIRSDLQRSRLQQDSSRIHFQRTEIGPNVFIKVTDS